MRSRADFKSNARPPVHSVKDLLARQVPALQRLSAHAAQQDFWNAWFAQHLPAQLRARVCGVAEHDATLVVYAQSAAWAARLRFALLERQSALEAAARAIEKLEVRVLPRG